MAKKKPPQQPEPVPNFFKRQCPACSFDMHLVRIIGEPISHADFLGAVVFCCYECHVIYISEPVTEQIPYLGITHFRRQLRQPDYSHTMQVYRDMLLYIESFAKYLVQASRISTVSERAVHLISSTYVFLQHVRRQLEDQLPPQPKDPT